ncbi:hypothetical protein GE09DRAFT_484898 [Coniochaeta sp. 2T2.1]|nr:hypothetical protein GE09DRAFT_484898 [Coniochaeta sp. 2T2.1]
MSTPDQHGPARPLPASLATNNQLARLRRRPGHAAAHQRHQLGLALLAGNHDHSVHEQWGMGCNERDRHPVWYPREERLGHGVGRSSTFDTEICPGRTATTVPRTPREQQGVRRAADSRGADRAGGLSGLEAVSAGGGTGADASVGYVGCGGEVVLRRSAGPGEVSGGGWAVVGLDHLCGWAATRGAESCVGTVGGVGAVV